MRYQFNDGLTLEASTETELLEQLWQKSFTPAETLEDFCKEMANRVADMTGLPIYFTNHAELVEWLVRAGMIESTGDGNG